MWPFKKKEMKLCVDCKWSFCKNNTLLCTHPFISEASGCEWEVNCLTARFWASFEGGCGLKAKYFEPK